jgi:hypothetical protein
MECLNKFGGLGRNVHVVLLVRLEMLVENFSLMSSFCLKLKLAPWTHSSITLSS